ncbi:peptide chain release factor 1, mitochondrial [Trichomonascus vanleenenianus]|uniref:Mrf1p n=1 Tax=Trichomonascus vanleenenianus TaxID=2268995 RepID=UPI003EC9E8DC
MKRAELMVQEHDRLAEELSAADAKFDASKATRVSRLSFVVEKVSEYQDMVSEYDELKQMLSDPSLRAEAEAELETTREGIESLAEKLQNHLVPVTNPFIDRPCLLELRPGVGGSEAMIFAGDLLAMYQAYALKRRWPFRVVSQTLAPTGHGVTEAILSIDEPGAYERLQYEGGVHRVQRVPDTESKGRVHTSTAAVVVLPQMNEDANSLEEAERGFAPGEVRIDVMRARGAGGQHVNTTDSAVRLTHIPSGIVVSMQDERSQHKNKAKAFMVLRARLAEQERIRKEQEERDKRTAQVSTTNRSDKIRTYNFAQNRITDHRCNYTAYNLDQVMTGELMDVLIDAMDRHSKTELIKQLIANPA